MDRPHRLDTYLQVPDKYFLVKNPEAPPWAVAVQSLVATTRRGGRPYKMAATNKCLARTNKTRTRAKATKSGRQRAAIPLASVKVA